MSDPVQQQQQQQQQQVLVYNPNGVNMQQQSQTLPSVHSKGSFGTSFIILAVIVVVSAAACFLSRLCNKKGQKKHKEPKQDKNHKQKNGQGGGGGPPSPTFPPQQSRRKEMEFGFGARVGPGSGPGFGFDKNSRQPKGSDLEMGFDKPFPSGKAAPPPPLNYMIRGQRPNHPNGIMNGAAIPHFNGARWPGRQ